MKRQKVTEPRNFGGHFWGQGAVAENIALQIRIPRLRFTKRKKFQVSEMKCKKVTEPRNFGGHFGGQGAVTEKKDSRFGFPHPDLLKGKIFRYPG